MANPYDLTVPPETIDPALRHVLYPHTSGLRPHRDFCLCDHPPVRVCTSSCRDQDWVRPTTQGRHFVVDPIRVSSSDPRLPPGASTAIFFVVVTLFPSAWHALNAAGEFFNAIEPSHPRADIDFARYSRNTALFVCMDDAVRAAVSALRSKS